MGRRFSVGVLFFLQMAFAALFCSMAAYAQQRGETAVKFDRMVHDFGSLQEEDPPVTCTFTFTNTGTKPVAIFSVVSSCGCTTPDWTKKPVAPGAKGEVMATFLNDQGPYHFDKALTVYTSDSRKPIVLRITGMVYPKNKSLRESYPVAMGPLGIQKRDGFDAGQIPKGRKREASATIANTSISPVKVTFSGKSSGLSVSVTPNPIPPRSIAVLDYSINTWGGDRWGRVKYTAKIAANGRICDMPLIFNAIVVDDFSDMTEAQRRNSPVPMENRTTISFKDAKRGAPLKFDFSLQNIGRTPLVIRSVEVQDNVKVNAPKQIAPGAKGTLNITVSTGALETGYNLFTVTVYTNSPERPFLNFFMEGNVVK